MDALTLETLTLTGTPEEMGHQHGEQLRDRIQDFVAMRMAALRKYAADRGCDSVEPIHEIGRISHGIASQWDPEGLAEHDAVADAAGVDRILLYTTANMTDMRDALLLGDAPNEDSEGCTAVLVPPSRSATRHAIVGQTWDLNPQDVNFVVALNRRPTVGLESWSIACVGCSTLVGMNAAGVTVGTTNIKTYGAKPGAGYMTLLGRVLRAPDVAIASELIRTSPRSGAHTYWLADATQQVEWEALPDRATLRTTEEGPIWRSNHCIAPGYEDLQGETPGESSKTRFARVGAILDAAPMDIEGMKALFSDRSDGVLSINRYEEDGQGTATNAVFIAVPATGQAFACRGPADRATWIPLPFGAN